MSEPASAAPDQNENAAAHEPDGVESIVPVIPIVLPIAGAVLMLLLASIAVFLA